MNRTLALLPLLPLLSLAIAACGTKNVPLFGSDTQPDGTLLLQGTAGFQIEAVMDLDAPQSFRLRFNGQYGVYALSAGPGGSQGPYDYLKVDVSEWIAGPVGYPQIPPDTYVVELVDASGTTWGQTPPITVHARNGVSQLATIIFVHLDGRDATWVLDPSMQDSDPATMETTVSNLSHEDVTVERCQLPGAAGGARTCTSLGSAAPGADFQTVETFTATGTGTTTAAVSALRVGSYERSLAAPTLGACELERIVVTGTRTLRNGATPPFAMSACNAF